MVAGSSPDEAIAYSFLNFPNLSSRTMVMVFTQPLTQMSTRRSFCGKARPAFKADNLTAICEPIV
jgi:hypothetical protein